MEAIAKKNSLKIKWVQIKICETVPYILKGKIDFALCVFQTAQRSEIVDFTAFMHTISAGGATILSNDSIKTPGDIRSSRVVVCRGEIGHELAIKVLKIPKKQLKIFETEEIIDIIAFVSSGRADIALADAVSIQNFINSTNNDPPLIKQLFREQPLGVYPNGIMVNKNQRNLKNWLNKQFKNTLKLESFQLSEKGVLENYPSIVTKI